MERKLSDRLMEDLSASLRTALSTQRIVNIARLAEEIRRRNEAENVALEDIQAQLVAQAQLFNAVMEFDSPHDGSGVLTMGCCRASSRGSEDPCCAAS